MAIYDPTKQKISAKSGSITDAQASSGPAGIPAPTATVAPVSNSDISKDYKNQVNNFQSNLPMMQDQMYEGAANQARSNLAGSLANIRSNANSRGLLYGGIHEGADQQATAQAAGGLAQTRMGINAGLEGQNDQMQQALLQSQLERYRGDVSANEKNYGLAMSRYGLDQQNRGNMMGGAGALAGLGIAAFSDKRLKKKIKSGDDDAKDLLDNIKPESYEYKDKEMGEGKHLSPMAQDLEKSEVGRSMVMDTPKGKMVDYGKGLGSMMAVMSALDRRLKTVEAKK